MATDPIRDRLALALNAEQEAGDMTLKWYQNPALSVIEKPDGSPVTPADKESERLIRAAISQQFPTDAILGEEQGDTLNFGSDPSHVPLTQYRPGSNSPGRGVSRSSYLRG